MRPAPAAKTASRTRSSASAGTNTTSFRFTNAMIAGFPGARAGNAPGMATIEVHPRNTPAERADTNVEVEVDEDLTVFAATIEDWVTPLDMWELQLREGHDFRPGEQRRGPAALRHGRADDRARVPARPARRGRRHRRGARDALRGAGRHRQA